MLDVWLLAALVWSVPLDRISCLVIDPLAAQMLDVWLSASAKRSERPGHCIDAGGWDLDPTRSPATPRLAQTDKKTAQRIKAP